MKVKVQKKASSQNFENYEVYSFKHVHQLKNGAHMTPEEKQGLHNLTEFKEQKPSFYLPPSSIPSPQ